MNTFAKSAGVVLAAAALCGLGLGTAGAAPQGQAEESGSVERVVVF
jgi:hypothetical protein